MHRTTKLAARVMFFATALTVGLSLAAPRCYAQQDSSSDGVGDLIGQLVGTLVAPEDDSEDQPQVLRGVCESKHHKRTYCPVDTSGGVRLVRQLSRASCEDNWGFDDGGIWVDNGCRAEFEVKVVEEEPTPVATPEPPVPAQRMIITCESKDGRRAFCSADTSAGVELVRTLSSESCAGNWGYDSAGIWVDRGCRAEFEVLKPAPEPTPVPVPKLRRITCRSTGGRQAFCAADTGAGVRFIRQLGSAPCANNWGYDSNGIWVANNCAAEFELGQPEPSGPTEVICRARTNKRQHCRAQVTVSIRLVEQLSNATCLDNWGFDENGLWVQNGCQAKFEVQ